MTNISVEQPIGHGIDEENEQDQSRACLVGHLHGDPFPGKDIEMDGHGPDGGEEGGRHHQGRTSGQNNGSGLPDAPSHTQDDPRENPGKGIGQDGMGDRLPFCSPQGVADLTVRMRGSP